MGVGVEGGDVSLKFGSERTCSFGARSFVMPLDGLRCQRAGVVDPRAAHRAWVAA